MSDKCYDCVYRRSLMPISAHSACDHPVTASARLSPFMQLAGTVGKRGGDVLVRAADELGEGPSRAMAELNVQAADLGVRNGWFIWPVNFDPVWLENCDGFEAISVPLPGGSANGYPPGWPHCTCGAPVLDGHLTCGRIECDEAGARAARSLP